MGIPVIRCENSSDAICSLVFPEYRLQNPGSARLMRSADCTQRGDAAGGGAAAAGPWAALRYSRGLMPCRGTRSREGTGFGIIPVKT